MTHQHMSKLAIILFGTFCAATSQAAENNFTGPAVGIRFSAQHNEVEYGGFLAGKSSSKNDGGVDIFAAYGIPLSGDWIANVGASYALNDPKFGTVNYISGGTQTVTARLKSHWSVFVEPGYRFAPQWLAYAKLGYHEARGEYNDSLVGRGTVNTQGFGYGAGIAYAYSHNIEASFEIQQIDFSRETVNLSNGKPTVTEAAVRFAYRF